MTMTLKPCVYRNANVKAREAIPDVHDALTDRDENAWQNSFKCHCPDVVGAKPAFVRKSQCNGCPHAKSDGEPVAFVALTPPSPCIHLGEVLNEIKPCCGQAGVTVKACSVHGECVATSRMLDALQAKQETSAAVCEVCPDFKAAGEIQIEQVKNADNTGPGS